MKIFIFFDFFHTRFHKLYKSKKEGELKKIISQIESKYSDQSPTFKIYCINKTSNYLKETRVNLFLKSILNEYIKVERDEYKQILRNARSTIIELYASLIKTDTIKLKYFWIILESEIKYYLYDLVERVEFINSIINREQPDLIFLLQQNTDYYKVLFHKKDIPKEKLRFFKSKLDEKYIQNSKKYDFIFQLIIDLKHLIESILKKKNEPITLNSKKSNVVGFILPRLFHRRGLDPVYKELNEKKIATNLLIPNFFKFSASLKDFSFKYIGALKLKLNSMFKSRNFKKKITQHIDAPWRDLFYRLVIKIFFKSINQILFWHDQIEQELKRIDYKMFIFCNEFFAEIKTLVFICKKYSILTCFLPFIGIPNAYTYTTPYYCDRIYVDGKLDKELLTKNGVDQEKIIVSGSIRHENLFKYKYKLSNIKDTFSGKKYSLSQNKTKILLATNPISIESNNYIFKSVANALRRLSNIQFILKLHPREGGLNYKKLLEEMGYNDIIIVKDVNLYDLLNSCDFLLTKDSSIILEAIVIGIPIICLDLMNKRIYFEGNYLYSDEKYVVKAYNEEDIYNSLMLFITNPKKLEEYLNEMKKNLQLFLFNKEGYSPTNKITSDIVKLIRDNKVYYS